MLRPSKYLCECGSAKSQVAKCCWECRKKRVTKKCVVCGSEFECKQSQKFTTCGGACASKLRGKNSGNTQSQKITIRCQSCGKDKLVSPAYRNRKYCSVACSTIERTGHKSGRWKGGITTEQGAFFNSRQWKMVCRDIWSRDRRTCQRCGSVHDETQRTYEVHHRGSWLKFPELRTERSNLVLLCRKCHQFVHSRANEIGEFIRNKS